MVEKVNLASIASQENSETDKDSLDALLQAIYKAGVEAQRKIQLHNTELLERYFPEGDDGERHPLTIKIPLPNGNGGYTDQDIPVFCLVNHHSLIIDELRVHLKVQLHKITENKHHSFIKSLLQLDLSSMFSGHKDSLADVEIKFKGVQPPEGLARVNDEIVRTIGEPLQKEKENG